VTALAGVAISAAAAPVNYQMDLRTQSGFGAGGVTGMLGMMMGGSGSSVSKSMDLQLTNPADIPDGYTASMWCRRPCASVLRCRSRENGAPAAAERANPAASPTAKS